MHQVSAEDILSVIAITQEIEAIRYIPSKKARLALLLEGASPNVKWVMSLFTVLCLFCPRLRKIDASRFYYVDTTPDNTATLDGFIRLLRRYDNVNVTPAREDGIARFVATCDKAHRDLFLSIMSKQWILSFPVTEMQQLLPLSSVTLEQIYGELQLLRTGFSELSYPIAVRAIPEGKATITAISKNPSSISKYDLREDGLVRVSLPDCLKVEAELSQSPWYALVCLDYSGSLYPIDYFHNLPEFLSGESLPYADRLEELTCHLERSIPIHTDNSSLVLARSEQSLIEAISSVSPDAQTQELLVCDNNSSRSGNCARFTRRIASGVIDSIWVEGDVAAGFNVWFNGELVKCPYKFSGAESSLVRLPHVVAREVLSFYYLTIGEKEYLIGKSIEWGAHKWRSKKLRNTPIMLSGCALCGSRDWPHANHGLCKSCEANLPYYFKKHAPGEWINPSPQMRGKRFNGVWKNTALNVVEYKHKGFTIEAKADGMWRFIFKESGNE